MALDSGSRLGPYEIVAPLGAGGMGEVYRARDPRLGREVAIKVLPPDTARDPERLRRFEREARAAGALNHPNILDVHDIGTHGGAPYVVSELLEGETLRERLRAGALSVRQAIDYATQLAGGLAAAHEKGIVHRDIKPENVFLMKEGRVKILDFGLAKLLPSGPLVQEDTAAGEPSTESEVVVGTVGYMSPEQIRGQAVDHRADIFAFGAVLHEMLSGRRAFRGGTSAETLTAILREDPPGLTETGREIPGALQRITRCCLEKDPAERFHSAHDLGFALGNLVELSAPSALSPGVAASSDRAPWCRWALALTSLALLVAVGVWLLPSRRSMAPMMARPLTSFAGAERHPALSPDGDRVAFTWNAGERLDTDIYVTLIGPGRPLQITDGPADDLAPVWSPDGQQLAFVRIAESDEESGVFVVPALGGAPRRVSAGRRNLTNPVDLLLDENIGVYSPLSWSPDGKELAIAHGEYGIVLLSLESLTERRLTPPRAVPAAYQYGDWHTAFSPDGTTVAFVRNADAGTGDIYTVPAAGGEPRRLTYVEEAILGLAWTPDGHYIVFVSGPASGVRRLWRIPSEGGERTPLPVGGESAATPSFSRRPGRFVFTSAPPRDTDICRVDLARSPAPRRPETALIASSRRDLDPAFSPDGRRIAFSSARSGNTEIWVSDAEGSNAVPLTSFGGPHTGTPRWSPDGREIAFDSRPEGHADIFVVPAEGGPPRRLTHETSHDVVPSWSGDGRWIYFASNRAGTWQVFKVPADGGTASQVTSGGGFGPLESPDGRFVYYAKGLAEPGLWRVPVEGGEESVVLEDLERYYWGYWAVVDEGIYFVDPRTRSVELLRFATGKRSTVARLEGRLLPGSPGLAISPDRRWALYIRPKQTDSDIMLVENFR